MEINTNVTCAVIDGNVYYKGEVEISRFGWWESLRIGQILIDYIIIKLIEEHRESLNKEKKINAARLIHKSRASPHNSWWYD